MSEELKPCKHLEFEATPHNNYSRCVQCGEVFSDGEAYKIGVLNRTPDPSENIQDTYNTPTALNISDTSAKADVEDLRQAAIQAALFINSLCESTGATARIKTLAGNAADELLKHIPNAALQAPRSDTSAVELVGEHEVLLEMEAAIARTWESKKEAMSPLHQWLLEEAAVACYNVAEKRLTVTKSVKDAEIAEWKESYAIDTIKMTEEIERLRLLVEAAYQEGFYKASIDMLDPTDEDYSKAWDGSKAKTKAEAWLKKVGV